MRARAAARSTPAARRVYSSGRAATSSWIGGARVAVQRGDLRAVLVAPRRQDDGDGLAAHGIQRDREPVREPVVAADHPVP
ncbi:hypothetical protein [Streptomyces sp. NPDC000851]